MFLRRYTRTKDGKQHTYYALVESVRTDAGPRQHVVAYLGELNHDQERRWQRTVVFHNCQGEGRQLRLFPDDDSVPLPDDPDVVRIRLDSVSWTNGRRFGDVRTSRAGRAGRPAVTLRVHTASIEPPFCRCCQATTAPPVTGYATSGRPRVRRTSCPGGGGQSATAHGPVSNFADRRGAGKWHRAPHQVAHSWTCWRWPSWRPSWRSLSRPAGATDRRGSRPTESRPAQTGPTPVLLPWRRRRFGRLAAWEWGLKLASRAVPGRVSSTGRPGGPGRGNCGCQAREVPPAGGSARLSH
jgi:hypothetical protein